MFAISPNLFDQRRRFSVETFTDSVHGDWNHCVSYGWFVPVTVHTPNIAQLGHELSTWF